MEGGVKTHRGLVSCWNHMQRGKVDTQMEWVGSWVLLCALSWRACWAPWSHSSIALEGSGDRLGAPSPGELKKQSPDLHENYLIEDTNQPTKSNPFGISEMLTEIANIKQAQDFT